MTGLNIIVKSSSPPTVEDTEYEFYLPEEVLAAIALTSPADACRLATVCNICRSVAESDAVWEQLLPSNYREIFARSDEAGNHLLQYPSKKSLYFRLVDHPLLIDTSTKIFWLEKFSGKVCCMISARSISIEYSDDPRFWTWTSIPESRFPDVAELLHVNLLEIRGKIDISLLSPYTNYRAYLIFRFADSNCGFGYDVETSVEVTAGFSMTRKNVFLLTKDDARLSSDRDDDDDRYGNHREDGWLEVMIGSFFSDDCDYFESEAKFSVLEINHLVYKQGLIVEGIEVRPYLL